MAFGFASIDDDDPEKGKGSSTVDRSGANIAPLATGTPGAAPANEAGHSYADQLAGTNAYGGTQSGFLNFSAFANANSGVANREAKKANEGVANASQKARQGIYDANDRFQAGLNGQPAPGSGGAAGPVLTGAAGPPPIVDTRRQDARAAAGTGAAPGAVPNSGTSSAPSVDTRRIDARAAAPAGSALGDDYRKMLEGKAAEQYAGPNGLADDAKYGQMSADTREGQRQLNALGSEAGLQALTGGTYADAALLNSQGSQAFGETRKNYGDLNKFQSNVEKNAGNQAQGAKNAASARAAEYAAKLGQYDEQAAANKAKADADKANAPKKPQSFGDMTANDTEHTMTSDMAGKRITTHNLTQVDPAGQALNLLGFNGMVGEGSGFDLTGSSGPSRQAAGDFMGQANVPKDQQEQTWQDFLKSLPEGMANYVRGMNMGSGAAVDAMGDKMATKNTDADWQWFNQLFNSYLQSKKGG